MVDTIEKVASIAQDQIDKENASDPVVIKALTIVESFIKRNRVLCYGGTAINNLLPKEDQFITPRKIFLITIFLQRPPNCMLWKLLII